MEKISDHTDLKKAVDSYVSIPDCSFQALLEFVSIKDYDRGSFILQEGQIAKDIFFVNQGVMRAFYTDAEGIEYNKIFFFEGGFATSTVSLLTSTPSLFSLEVLEDAIVTQINFQKFRKMIESDPCWKDFYLAYLEKNWVIYKEQREIDLVTKNATERYLKLLQGHPDIERRISKKHIASHLGITPTQLSRIRKELKNNFQNQHM